MQETSTDYVWEGFWYTVRKNGKNVIKTPRNMSTRNLWDEKTALETHQKHLDQFIPDTSFKWDKSAYEVHQEFIEWDPVNLMNSTNDKVFELLDTWISMQEREKILFDIFWLEWMVRLFNYYYWDTLLGKTNNFALPLSWRFLQMLHNFPYSKIKALNDDHSSPFVSENILEDKEWNVSFVDIEHRWLSKPKNFAALKKYPLNLLWAWITKKALKDIMWQRNKKTIK